MSLRFHFILIITRKKLKQAHPFFVRLHWHPLFSLPASLLHHTDSFGAIFHWIIKFQYIILNTMGNIESAVHSPENFVNYHVSHGEHSSETSCLSKLRLSHHHQEQQSFQMSQQHPAHITDNFTSLDQVISSLRDSGLESSNLILGIDLTKSNEWTGRYSFGRRCLHDIHGTPNPYEQAISIIGRTLAPFDEDNLVPCFGFGDASTQDQHVFSFYADHRYCNGFEEALGRYKEIVPHLTLSGPTSFSPIIDAAIDIVEQNNGQYHVLVIIADGQVTRNPDVPSGIYSPQEKATIKSIVNASRYPLSIILVGVGDGPWDSMHQFDDNIPQRFFDNFQFVNFTNIMSENKNMSKRESAFALAALMEIPSQYRATLDPKFRKLPKHRGSGRRPLPPPPAVIDHDNRVNSMQNASSSKSSNSSCSTEQVCSICLTNPKDMAFGCGHLTCKECGASLAVCPMCRAPITTRLRLYS